MSALEEAGENEIEVVTLMRGRDRRYDPNGNIVLKAGDIVILQGEPAALERVVGAGKAQARARRREPRARHADRRDRRHGGGGHRRIPSWSTARRCRHACTTATTSTCWR